MSNNTTKAIDVEFYTPYEINIDNICIITLHRKIHSEIFYESKEVIESFKKDEDTFLSWLMSISSSKGYSLARAVIRDNGVIIEALYSSIRRGYIVNYPCLSRVRRIYAIHKLNTTIHDSKSLDSIDVKNNILLLRDFSNDELYVFSSYINIIDSSKIEALLIETDSEILTIRPNELDYRVTATSIKVKRGSKKSKSKKKRRKKTKKRSRKSTKLLS